MDFLYIEDDSDFSDFISEIINTNYQNRFYNWNITIANNFKEGLKFANSNRFFDIVVSDTELGDGKGFDLLPIFIDREIKCLLVSGSDFSKEAQRIGCPFLIKNIPDILNYISSNDF